MNNLRIAMIQTNPILGDIQTNALNIIAKAKEAIEQGASIIVFGECSLTGYPPEDLILRNDFYISINAAIDLILSKKLNAYLIFGYPAQENNETYNQAVVIHQGKIVNRYNKQFLPNYAVFDEKRYFSVGDKHCIIEIGDIKFAILICEDIWHHKLLEELNLQGVSCILALNGSPFSLNKYQRRLSKLSDKSKKHKVNIIYVNLVGGQDELIFDGGSLAINADGILCANGASFKEDIVYSDMDLKTSMLLPNESLHNYPNEINQVIKAITLGLHDYVQKNNFPGVVIALSGGIDSAVTLALAVKALGADKVRAIYLPSQYNADISALDAQKQCELLNVCFNTIPIETIFQLYLKELDPIFADKPTDVTEENLQARIRANIIMAISNKFGSLVLATGNKSELAVGYCTLYGDMCGGFAPIKDVLKTQVYALAQELNKDQLQIPERVISRPPSAELSANQKDQDSLPKYADLDQIISLFVEKDLSANEITKQTGLPLALVKKIIKLIVRNEYKRSQAPIGARITQKAFGKDRRYPITNSFF